MALAAVQPLLLADVLPHRRLVEAHRAHAVPDGPEVQAHPPLLAKVAEDPPDLPPQLAVQRLATVLWYEHHVILAVPPDVGLRFPFVHRVLLSVMCPGRGLPGGEPMRRPRREHAG